MTLTKPPTFRYARQVHPADNYDPVQVEAYLPDNYWLRPGDGVIEGEDYAGWTLDGYVLPRLRTGLFFFEEFSE